MRLRSTWARPIVFTVAVVVILASQAVGTVIYGHLRTPPQVSSQLQHHGSADMAVVLDFTPEQFNLDYLQSQGDIVHTQGNTIFMSGLSSSAVTTIAGQYWVGSVRPWNGG